MANLCGHAGSCPGDILSAETFRDILKGSSRLWFQIFLFLPLFGEDSHFD